MKDESSIFNAEPENLDRLVFEILGEPEAEEDSSATVTKDGILEQPGVQIGRYKLLSILGEGGMGIVYLAKQEEPLKRQVALKIIKPGMDSKRVMARFEAEKQALALMQHPNIADVYDAGLTLTGRPYFVMEYVKGTQITDYCDNHKLTIDERLRLFQQVCQAVQHAHQKGIIHRDIKPSNILVTTQDEKAVPKIIDFGVAKALAQPLTERTLATEDSQLLGTPEYMSPEQADMATEDIDTRSDIYSLGVLLYVLLTSVLPFDSVTFREGGIEHIRQIIRETDPKTPSSRLSYLGEEAQKVAQSRRTELTILTKCLHRELEWIPLKAMRKERSERYRSASELADDIENYLRNTPLIAGPPKTMYKLRKFIRRNRALVTGVVSVLVVLIAGIIASMLFAVGQSRIRTEAQAVSDFLRNSVLASLDPFKVGGREITVRSVLDAASKSLEGDFKGTPLAEAEIQDTLGNAYWSLGLYNRSESHLKRALDIQQAQRGFEHPATLMTAHQLGWVYFAQSRYREAEQLLVQTLETRRSFLGEEHPGTIYSTIGIACVYNSQGCLQQAEELLRKTLEITRRLLGEEHLYVPGIMNAMAWNYELQGRYEEAKQIAEQGLEIANRTLDENDWVALLLKHTIGRIYAYLGCYPEAEKYLQMALKGRLEAWGQEHPDTLQTTVDLGWLYYNQGCYGEAELCLERTLTSLLQVLGETHITTSHCMHGLGTLYLSRNQYDKAENLLQNALRITDDILGEENWASLSVKNTLGKLYIAKGNFVQAEELYLKTIDARKRKLGKDHPATLESKNDLGVLYKEQGRFSEAEPLLLESIKGQRIKLGYTHSHTIESLNNLIALYEAWNKPEKAEKWRAKLPKTEAVGE